MKTVDRKTANDLVRLGLMVGATSMRTLSTAQIAVLQEMSEEHLLVFAESFADKVIDNPITSLEIEKHLTDLGIEVTS